MNKKLKIVVIGGSGLIGKKLGEPRRLPEWMNDEWEKARSGSYARTRQLTKPFMAGMREPLRALSGAGRGP